MLRLMHARLDWSGVEWSFGYQASGWGGRRRSLNRSAYLSYSSSDYRSRAKCCLRAMLSDTFHSLRLLQNISWHNDVVTPAFEDDNS